MNEIKVGEVAGTGAALNVSLGFVPDYVEVWNGTAGAVLMKWWIGLDAGQSLKIDGTPSVAKVAANGITAYEGDDDNGAGFTIGADADLNVAGDKLFYIAMRSGAGAQ